jgi:hypothetical protein
MTPVVNGLKSDFGELVDIRLLNAGFGTGQRAFSTYGLPGHPSYIILHPTGEVLWTSFGPQPKETISTAIEEAIAAVEK